LAGEAERLLLELPRMWRAADLAGGFGLPDSQPVAGKIEQFTKLGIGSRRQLRRALADRGRPVAAG
jgi:hypothetical protein